MLARTAISQFFQCRCHQTSHLSYSATAFLSIILLAINLSPNLQAQSAYYEVTHEGRKVNTVGSESGPIKIGDTLYYSSLQEVNEGGGYIDFGLATMLSMKSKVSESGNLSLGEPTSFGINHPTRHTGNLAFDTRSETIFFTRCKVEEPYQNEIFFIKKERGSWSKPQKLQGDINIKGYNTTQPSVGYTADGSTILYFVSDRPGGLGGMDIWYSIINDGIPAPATNLGSPVNTADDEITPFYDNSSATLYFSSNRSGGIGKHDVYSSKGSRNSWRTPQLLPEPINSIEDDLYFSVNQDDITSGYLTSNRSDSYFLYDTSCCHDIYNWHYLLQFQPRDTVTHLVETVEDTCPCRKARLLLPIRLFFHNDEPNPRSLDTISSLTYFQTYNSYMFMRSLYKEKQYEIIDTTERSMAIASLESFFGEVQYNSEKFEHFIYLLAQDILSGRHVVLTVGGYASPLHSSSYNVNLSKRRISTIVNQLKEYDNGLIRRIMGQPGSGSLEIKESPFGSSTAPKDVSSSANDQLHSIYSVDAARERRIEILSYEYQ